MRTPPSSRPLRAAAFSGVVLLFAARGSAQGPRDGEALAASHDAMSVDFAGARFQDAEQKLLHALSLCGRDECSRPVLALLHRDLGVVYIAGSNRTTDGMAELVQALALDPEVTLDEEMATEEVRRAFAEAALSAGVSSPAGPATTRPAPPSDLLHVPPAEQVVNTPVPLYAEAAGSHTVRMRARYRAFGLPDWKGVDLPRLGAGFGGEVPCADLGTTGTLEYFLQAYDEHGDVEATSGSRKHPHRVTIVHALRGAAPSLPGRPPPVRCKDASDCPPDFPGCSAPAVSLPPPRLNPISPPRPSYDWVSVTLQQDFFISGGASGVCSGASDYSCFAEGAPFEADVADPVAAGEVVGGVLPATTRVLAGYDRVLSRRWSLGTRLGFAFRGGPEFEDGGTFLPIHAEGRGAFWFGADPFSKTGFRPYVQVSGGVAQLDAEVTVSVYENEAAVSRGVATQVDAVRRSGVPFASVGAGTQFALGVDHGVAAELRICQHFGAATTSVALSIGYAYGL